MERERAALVLHLTPRNKPADIPPGIILTLEDRPRPEFGAQPALPSESYIRHNGWAAGRAKIWAALTRSGTSRATLDRFAECGSGLTVHYNPHTDAIKLGCNCCRNRWCVACGVERSAKMAANLRAQMKLDTCRFITLTRRHSHAPLADQLDSLYAAFAKLRHRGWFKATIAGGAAFLELKTSEKTGLWHVHLHLIVTGNYIDQRELSRQWLACTIDSAIVDVRSIPTNEDVARYVTKYVTKPMDSNTLNDQDRCIEMIVNLKGRRLCLTFGTWRGLKLTEGEPPAAGWIMIGTISQLYRDHCDGQGWASRAYHMAKAKLGGLLAWLIYEKCGPPAAVG